jgi:hypothetical protein
MALVVERTGEKCPDLARTARDDDLHSMKRCLYSALGIEQLSVRPNSR